MKSIVSKIVSVLLIVSICFTITPIQGQAAKNSRKNYVITIKKISSEKTVEAVAKKIHKNLTNGKTVILKIKGKSNQKRIHTQLDKIRASVGKINRQGVGFEYFIMDEKGKYVYYKLTDPGSYKYAQKFVKKLYSITRKMIMKDETSIKFYEDYKKYSDFNTLKMHILYDKLCDRYRNEYDEISGFSEPTTTPSIYCMRDERDDAKLTKLSVTQEKDLIIKKEEVRTVEWSVPPIKYAEFNSFDEFKEKLTKYPKALNAVALHSLTGGYKSGNQQCYLKIELLFPEEQMPTILIMQTKNFGDLPQATQLYAIDRSYYFSCQYRGTEHNKSIARVQGLKKAYCMYYDTKHNNYNNNSRRMKNLYLGKAAGVCMNFAAYERDLFALLGMDVFSCFSNKINHSYTVLKIKNTKGKVIWVPFDYGIGPSESLNVSKKIRNKYLKTEKMRYKVYLTVLKGAPKKKNFTMADFI